MLEDQLAYKLWRFLLDQTVSACYHLGHFALVSGSYADLCNQSSGRYSIPVVLEGHVGVSLSLHNGAW